ncbi:MAG: hypothetical protein ACOYO1_05105 [Bacteroidales bacterium]
MSNKTNLNPYLTKKEIKELKQAEAKLSKLKEMLLETKAKVQIEIDSTPIIFKE